MNNIRLGATLRTVDGNARVISVSTSGVTLRYTDGRVVSFSMPRTR